MTQASVEIITAESTSVDILSSETQVEVTSASQAIAEIVENTITTVVEVSTPQPQQPIAAIRIDASTNGIIYVGRASYGSSESAEVWTITQTTYSMYGVQLTKLTATGVTWTGRSSHTYT